MFKRSRTDFFLFLARAYTGRRALLVGLLVLAGLAEGVGNATLLPVLEIGSPAAGRDPAISHQAAMREVADVVYRVDGGSLEELSDRTQSTPAL